MPLLNMLDHVSDITMTVHFLSHDRTTNLGYISLLIIILQRVASAAILGDHYGWETGLRQFFDIEVFFAMYHSIRSGFRGSYRKELFLSSTHDTSGS